MPFPLAGSGSGQSLGSRVQGKQFHHIFTVVMLDERALFFHWTSLVPKQFSITTVDAKKSAIYGILSVKPFQYSWNKRQMEAQI